MATQAQTQTTGKEQYNLLRRALQGNGVFCSISGLVFLLAARPVAEFLGVGQPLFYIAMGIVLLLYGVDLLWFATRQTIDRRLAWLAVGLDTLWVAGSVLLLVTGWVEFSGAGKWAVAIVADVVALFAIAQYLGIRRLS